MSWTLCFPLFIHYSKVWCFNLSHPVTRLCWEGDDQLRVVWGSTRHRKICLRWPRVILEAIEMLEPLRNQQFMQFVPKGVVSQYSSTICPWAPVTIPMLDSSARRGTLHRIIFFCDMIDSTRLTLSFPYIHLESETYIQARICLINAVWNQAQMSEHFKEIAVILINSKSQ